ncbi:MAG: T9SS type A sorting domain-containing protein, partial [Flavobacterium sp.]|uniref:T9SS type A sorting domain-containing protein n=1 Tax=Flavobacterium sp. TaxID=239 RepID=UPI002FCA890D
MYVSTRKGIYRKNIATTLNDTLWQLYAFPDVPIRNFVKKNDTILAITGYEATDTLMVRSTDSGQTYTDFTSPSFFDITPINALLQIDQHPQNPNEVVLVHRGYGISKSSDFGATWTLMNTFLGGYQDWFVGYNPNDPQNIMYTGEEIFFQSYIQSTYDGGASWQRVDSLQTHCTHGVAFHPTDKNTMISYGEGRIAKSVNQGMSWTDTGGLPIYIYKVVYDPNNPNTVYATGSFHGVNNVIVIYRSNDAGDSWHLSYTEAVPEAQGGLDLHLYNNKLIVYTLVNGIYTLDIGLLDLKKEQLQEKLLVYPNPSSSVVNIENEYNINSIQVFDTAGRKVLSKFINNRQTVISIETFAEG